MGRRAWTCAEVRRLRAMREEGLPVAACAERLGRTVPAIECMIRKIGARHRRRWTDEEDERLRNGWMRGERREDLAIALGRRAAAVTGRLYVLRLGRAGSLVPEAH